MSPNGCPECVPALAQAVADPVLPPSTSVLYVTNAGSGDVSSMAIGPGGTLRLLGTPVSTGGCTPVPSFGTSTVAITPDGRDVFANVQDKSLVHAFATGSGGRLTEAPGSPFKTGGSRPLFQSLAIRPVPANTPQ